LTLLGVIAVILMLRSFVASFGTDYRLTQTNHAASMTAHSRLSAVKISSLMNE